METWETILLAISGNAALLAVLGYIGKSLLEKILVRDTKRFESEMKAKTDTEIEKLRNELLRSVESYKVQLKKSEFLFQKEFEAASGFIALLQSIHPMVHRPLMDTNDFHDEIANSFGKIEIMLRDFLTKFGAVLIDEERQILTVAMVDAGFGKFNVLDGPDEEIDAETNKQARTLYESLQTLQTKLVARVRDQSRL